MCILTFLRCRRRDIHEQLQATQMNIRGEDGPLSETPAFVANRQNANAVPDSDAVPKFFLVNGKKVPTKTERKEALQQKQAKRAEELKAKYPDMKRIPPRIGHGMKAKLIAEYRANHARITEAAQPELSAAASNGALTEEMAQLTEPTTKGQARARALKRACPGMRNIPDSIGKSLRQKLINAHLSQNPGTLPPAYLSQKPNALPPKTVQKGAKQVAPPERKSARLAQMPKRSSNPAGQHQQPTHQYLHHQGSIGRRVGNKMAPLSDERRAEVARNLEGTSNDDPINLD